MRRSVAGIAVESMRVFIARRVSGGSMGEKWEFPGGKVEKGETDRAALVREYQEEFAVHVRVGDKLAEAVFEHKGTEVQLTAYQVFFDSKDFVLSEHTDWRWVTLSEIDQLDFADSDLKLISGLRGRAIIAER